MRRIKITDKKINDILLVKESISLENQNILVEMEKMEKKFQSNISKMARADEKARPLIKKIYSTLVIKEYEELSRVFNDGGTWTMEIADRMEEFKTLFAKKNAK
jgi:hypothetical protein